VGVDSNPTSQIWKEENPRLEQDKEKAPRIVSTIQLLSNPLQKLA
jgi:hypothetical protein